MCDPILFENITPALYQALEDKAAGAGITIEGNRATYEKYVFSWIYNVAAGELTVQCLEKPWTVPCFAVESRLRSLVTAAREPLRNPVTGDS